MIASSREPAFCMGDTSDGEIYNEDERPRPILPPGWTKVKIMRRNYTRARGQATPITASTTRNGLIPFLVR